MDAASRNVAIKSVMEYAHAEKQSSKQHIFITPQVCYCFCLRRPYPVERVNLSKLAAWQLQVCASVEAIRRWGRTFGRRISFLIGCFPFVIFFRPRQRLSLLVISVVEPPGWFFFLFYGQVGFRRLELVLTPVLSTLPARPSNTPRDCLRGRAACTSETSKNVRSHACGLGQLSTACCRAFSFAFANLTLR